MTRRDVMTYVTATKDKEIIKYIEKNYEDLSQHEDLSVEIVQGIFTEKRNEMLEMLRTGTQQHFNIANAVIVDHIIEVADMSGDTELKQVLQKLYDNLILGMVAERMCEIARDNLKTG